MSQRNRPVPSTDAVSLDDSTPEPSAATPRPTVPESTATGHPAATTSSRKVCAYVTRNDEELLVFEGPGHEGLQVPKGTVEGTEPLRRALSREVHEESGLRPCGTPTPLASDVWMRRNHPPRYYVRHFFHVTVDDPRDAWTHTVTGTGEEVGTEFAYSWIDLDDPTELAADFDAPTEFALDLDDYVPLLQERL
ncbi:NUDIX domain-containing protein [Halorubellus sp. PRR65]|uniref:NUDIX hydrolase n=1 Tax=Halorubellus sp. PRR65 TaxID=3098148 RepID=UPI002B25F347|nr:NUDIX domain-containing protein [Halorubellus sp. PRR65]